MHNKGSFGEDAAAAYLMRAGYAIKTRNYKAQGAEIDIIAENADYLVFAEVKASLRSGYDDLAARVDQAKQRRISRAALHYIIATPTEKNLRFDVVLIGSEGILHIEDAFPYCGPDYF